MTFVLCVIILLLCYRVCQLQKLVDRYASCIDSVESCIDVQASTIEHLEDTCNSQVRCMESQDDLLRILNDCLLNSLRKNNRLQARIERGYDIDGD